MTQTSAMTRIQITFRRISDSPGRIVIKKNLQDDLQVFLIHPINGQSMHQPKALVSPRP
ncbi:hypothetical protein SAMN05421848_2121 [Kushneria avicenniae]|uniref:Uncharacterized protein n=1 Tax=Kushneria avicenniae TaxID=402385 RepID=A0A1I1KQ05_9GAMM|nr:hypothetical protein SAMN05421848_2121 [Kushneria avicenniae]